MHPVFKYSIILGMAHARLNSEKSYNGHTIYGPFCKFTGDDLISTHLCGHDPLWTYMWDLRSPGVGKDFWQISHLCGFSCKGTNIIVL